MVPVSRCNVNEKREFEDYSKVRKEEWDDFRNM